MSAPSRFSQRQVAMLKEMGVPLWQAPWAQSATESASESAPEPSTEPPTEPTPAAIPASTPAIARQAPAIPVHAPTEAAIAPAPDLARLTWPELASAVTACQACGLSQTRTQTVFGVGAKRAYWMVVGEAPGEQEDLSGEPFVGAAGQLLDQMLRSMGLTRSEDPGLDPKQQVYIANTLKCRPPRNRNPERMELERCEPFLVRQIELVQPKLILAMGRFAVQALLRTDEAIGKLRGRVHRYQGVPLVVTYHPAYLLRNLSDKAKAWEDLCLAMDTVNLS